MLNAIFREFLRKLTRMVHLNVEKLAYINVTKVSKYRSTTYKSSKMKRTSLFLSFIFCLTLVFGQETEQNVTSINFWTPSPELNKKRMNTVVVGTTSAYAVTMLGLNRLWYADFKQTSFHTFNDSKSWLGVDKYGHATGSYWASRYSMDMLRWAGMEEEKSRWIGAGMGWLALNSIEFYDGFSEEWGFSFYDMMANTAGVGLLVGQDALWGEQRITPKWSSSYSDYAQYNPKVLGNSFFERLLKDYNGQTYWASINIHSFLAEGNKFPAWLNFAVGVGGDGMLTSDANGSVNFPPEGVTIPEDMTRYRQYYLSFDVDLHKIPTNFGPLKTLAEVFGFIKIPAPTLEFNQGGDAKFHALFF